MKTLSTVQSLFMAAVAAVILCGAAQAGVASGVLRKKVAGIDVIVYRTGVKDVVTMSGSLPAGNTFGSTGNIAVPTLTGMMLDKGTAKQDQFQIAARLERVGAELRFTVDSQMLAMSGRMLKQDLAMVVELLAEQLRYPAFNEAELTKVKSQFIGKIRQDLENPGSRANEAFSVAIYPEGHPNRPFSAQRHMDAAPGATIADLKAFHAKHFGPANMTLVFVGDVDAKLIHAQVEKAFNHWQGGVGVIRANTRASKATMAREASVEIAGKTSANIVIGQAIGIDYHHPDAIALRLGTAILGSGFTGRLMASVRDREGLTYGIGAGVTDDTFSDGVWQVNATFAPNLLGKGIASTRRELEKWWKDGVTAEELEARKTNMIGKYQVGLATTGGMASMLLRAAELGYEMSWLDEYPRRIEALTLDQVDAAIKKHLDPGTMLLVKAGTLGIPAAATPLP